MGEGVGESGDVKSGMPQEEEHSAQQCTRARVGDGMTMKRVDCYHQIIIAKLPGLYCICIYVPRDGCIPPVLMALGYV